MRLGESTTRIWRRLRESGSANLDGMNRSDRGRMARRIIACVALILVAAAVVLCWPARTPPAEPVPSPNGYDDFLKAAALLSPTTYEYRELAEADLRKMVNSNAPALKLVRSALELECRVPVEYSTDYFNKHWPELSSHRKLAIALLAEGHVAELDQRTNDAARCYLDAIRLSNEAARGGMHLDHLSTLGYERMGTSKLRKIVSSLNARECRLVIATLESIESKRESPDEPLRIERAWVQAGGLKHRIYNIFYSKSLDPVQQSHRKYQVLLQAEIARQSQLRIDLAKRAYELENGHPPVGLNVLVPAYLKTLPQIQPPSANASSASRLNR